ncbi:MAG: adenosylhomocysteinase [Candidatus Verstraetearchaeota archaeon]|nr:adenosylhomocysteinase [Candidatus Verstraetearchaeota archaeon]
MESKVKDRGLAESGKSLLRWAEDHMPVLMSIRRRFSEEKPLRGITIAACLHVTKETGVLIRTLVEGGAKVALAGSNPLSTQDEVAAALAEEGISVFAWRGQTKEEYYSCLREVLSKEPQITMDDGADLITILHSGEGNISKVAGGTEETTTGVVRLKAMAEHGVLKYPVIAVNNAETKWDFDNVYGTGQSTLDGIMRATNVLLAGKNFVVAGYGHCGRGLANRARGMGAKVIVTEIDPMKALKATMDGFAVMPMEEASKIGDIFVTATGNKSVIRREHFRLMKGGAILANTGHFNVEIDISALGEEALEKRRLRQNVDEYLMKDGRKIYLLAEGRLVNLAAAEGHPSEVMDMSFANQALSVEYIIKEGKRLKPDVYDVPNEIDRTVAKLKLDTMGVRIDTMTREQEAYVKGWSEGTE